MREVKPTQKPVPSSDIKDLFFNSGLLDIWATSLEHKYIDRFGNCHLTAAGMEWLFKELVEKFKVDMNVAIVAAGYITIDSFQQGADLPNNELTQRNHILRDETTGEYYRWDGDLPKQVPLGSTPQSTGGISKGAWVSVGDASFRSDIRVGDGSLVGLSKGTLRDAVNYFTPEMWGCVGNDVTVDNMANMIRMFNEVPTGSIIDFGGKSYRVLDGINGIPSSGANPAADNALDFDKCIVVRDKSITLINGAIYPANQGVSPDKRYYPTTVSFIDSNVHFENFTIEGRGENFGDADASKSQSHARRLEFLATNGGHAAYFARSEVYGNLTTRLCGSVSPMYFSSCPIVRMGTAFSNPASLGYAPYAFDAWVGNAADISPTGEFRNSIQNAWAFKETIRRREDSAIVGSTNYSGKGGIVSEDRGVRVFIDNAYISDQFANGGGRRGKELGYAVGAGSGSSIIVDNLIARNCQEVAWLSWSVNELSSIVINNVDAEVRLCGAMVSGGGTYGRGYINFSSGRIHIDGSKVWDGEVEGLSTTSLLASTRTLTPTECHFNIDVTGNVQSLITNKVGAMYGSITFEGGNYETNGNLILSEGWGAPQGGSRKGIVFKDGCIVNDKSDKQDALVQYSNKDVNGVYTYIYHDFSNVTLHAKQNRVFDKYTIQNQNLVELFSIPDLTNANCYSLAFRRVRGVTSVSVIDVQGLSGANTRVKIQLLQNSGVKVGNVISTNTSSSRISAVESTSREGNFLYSVVLIGGDVRNQLTANAEYTLIC